MSKRKKSSGSRKKRNNIVIGQKLLSIKREKEPLIIKKENIQKTEKVKKPEPKKEIKQPSKTKLNKKTLIIVAIITCFVAIVGFFGYKYVYNNYLKKGNYIFETNIKNITVELIDNENKLETIKENVSSTTLYENLGYDQIKISNKDYEEIIDKSKTYFKYYGEKDIILLANNKYTIDYFFYTPIENQNISFTTDSKAINITDNIINAKDNGEATVYVNYGDTKTELLKVISTNLVVERPETFDESKPFLKCDQYTSEENKLLDKILETKINKAGYKTRAGAVEALRFLSLDFPYRINYFNENGRLPNVDAQGRYYHKGLYLSKDKYSELLDPSDKSNGAWGCSIYSIPLEANQRNGLDCSGLIGWALYNDGFDLGDYKGADLQIELGEIVSPKEAINSGRIKVGDLLHNDEGDSHIAMIVGIDDQENYYVCQSIWYKPIGVGITKYSKSQFINHWLDVALMDDYYKEDGNLTNMWY